MSEPASITRTVDVRVDPATAFKVFTEEIGAWYRSGRYSWNDPDRAVGIRFEPGDGGRLIEVWDETTGEGYEMGRVIAWEPGTRILFQYRNVSLPPAPLTEVEVRFHPVEGGTRVTLEHRGFDGLPPEIARTWEGRAWIVFMRWFAEYAGRA